MPNDVFTPVQIPPAVNRMGYETQEKYEQDRRAWVQAFNELNRQIQALVSMFRQAQQPPPVIPEPTTPTIPPVVPPTPFVDDHKFSISGADKTFDFASIKLVEGVGVHFDILNPGLDEKLQINATGDTLQGILLPCRVASTADVDLTAPGSSMDGVSFAVEDRVLLKDQTDEEENGVYIWTGASLALTRALDADTAAKLLPGILVAVSEGDENKNSLWQLTTPRPITLETTALTWDRKDGFWLQATILGSPVRKFVRELIMEETEISDQGDHVFKVEAIGGAD